jgi:hypothetical protein
MNLESGTLNVVNCTIVDNSSGFAGGGILSLGVLNLKNSLVAGNTVPNGSIGPDIALTDGFDSIVGSLASNGGNFIGVTDGIPSGVQPTDKTFASTGTVLSDVLAPLADNSGPTMTHALVTGSPAINGGISADALDQNGVPLPTDQRGPGFARISGGTVDIGAFEVQLTYSWSGFLQPINADGTSVFKLGRTVPIKFQLTGASAGITNAKATFSYTKVASSAGSVNEAVSTATADTGNTFRYDPTSNQYIFNWNTKGLTTGSYQIKVDLGDGVNRTVIVGLR